MSKEHLKTLSFGLRDRLEFCDDWERVEIWWDPSEDEANYQALSKKDVDALIKWLKQWKARQPT